MTDIEIAQGAKLLPIQKIAENLGIDPDLIEPYGRYKAKLPQEAVKNSTRKAPGKLVLVTAINPTPAGEGKTTTTVGLGQAMHKIGKKAVIALREPSLGPVFGIKGGAAGGGYSQVVPMEDINLHFTGDMHAITSANNLLCAMVDNHIQQGNSLNIDTRRILIKRCMDMNDRALRQTVVGLGGKINGVPREDGFIITVASEIMAILCLTTGIRDLKERLGNILVAYTTGNVPVFAKDLDIQGAMAALLKEAIKPNLVQTLENTPAIMHGGPFANIAHGCNSIQATKMAVQLGDYAITEAGFGSDLGAEKFFDIKCRCGGLKPDCVVLVATVRALKYNGGIPRTELTKENVDALKNGVVNLRKHIGNMKSFGLPVVVAINKFREDTAAELQVIQDACRQMECAFAVSDTFAKGGEGGVDLAQKVTEACNAENTFHYLYDENESIKDKIHAVVTKIYGGDGAVYAPAAEKAIRDIEELGWDKLPVCIAKTPASFTDDPAKLGCPSGFSIHVNDIRLSAGAGFIVVLTGNIMTMPGLPKTPSALFMDIDENGNISGLS